MSLNPRQDTGGYAVTWGIISCINTYAGSAKNLAEAKKVCFTAYCD